MDQSPKNVFGDLVVTGNLTVGSAIAGTGDITATGDVSVAGTAATLEVTDQVLISEAPGDQSAAPDLAFGDGDTGLWESADDTLKVGTGGTARVTIDSTGLTAAAALVATTSVTGATVVGNTSVSTPLSKVTATPGAHAAAPDLAFGDGDTGLYESADDTLQITTGGTARASVTSTGIAAVGDVSGATVTATTTAKVTRAPGAHAAAPDLAFGDLDTGLWESADDTLKVGTAGVERVSVDSTGVSVTGVMTATSTVKTTVSPGAHEATPDIALGDGDTGLWESADDTLKIGTAGVERVSVDATAGVVVAAALSMTFQGMTWRMVASGTGTAVNTAMNTVLGTFTRQAGEVMLPMGFVVEDATAAVWQYPSAFFNFARTTNANEFTLKFENTTGTNRTLDWVLWAVKAA